MARQHRLNFRRIAGEETRRGGKMGWPVPGFGALIKAQGQGSAGGQCFDLCC